MHMQTKIPVLEPKCRAGVLLHDGKLSRTKLGKLHILPSTTLRRWETGETPETSCGTLLRLDRHMHERVDVPWDSSFTGTSLNMWYTSTIAAQQAVICALQAERAQGGKNAHHLASRIHNAKLSPVRAEDVCPRLYRESRANALRVFYGHSVTHYLERFQSPGFPGPGEAMEHREDVTTVLLLAQYARDAEDPQILKQDILRKATTWLEEMCAPHVEKHDRAWAMILQMQLAELMLRHHWDRLTTVAERKVLLGRLNWFSRLARYHDLVRGDYTATRNALATASAIGRVEEFERYYSAICRFDNRWEDLDQMHRQGLIDSDFDELRKWWCDHRRRP